MTHEISCIVMAAGKGTRMKSALPKVLHPLAGKPMLSWLLDTLMALAPKNVVVVAGPDMPGVEAAAAQHMVVIQKDRRGTADAVKTALPLLHDFHGDVLILNGDVPLVGAHALQALATLRRQSGAGLALAAFEPADPSGYGRVLLREDNSVARIVEERDASPEEKKVTLCNAGLYCVDGARLGAWIAKIENKNAQGEFYLTDIVDVAAREGAQCVALRMADAGEVAGANSRADLAILERAVQSRLRHAAMEGGATLSDPDTVYFSWDTKTGCDVRIGQSVVFGPGVEIADGAEILPFCHIEGARIESGARIGPFARLRPGTQIGAQAHIGNFVEIKKSTIGMGAKAGHLAYIGDASVGADSNIGAGAITCNYDGYNKHKTTIGEKVFVGSDSTLVAPVEIGDGAYVAAGSTITRDVPGGALAVARNRPIIREGWADQYGEKKGKKG